MKTQVKFNKLGMLQKYTHRLVFILQATSGNIRHGATLLAFGLV